MPSPKYSARKPRSRPAITVVSQDTPATSLRIVSIFRYTDRNNEDNGVLLVTLDRPLTSLDFTGSNWEIRDADDNAYEATGASGSFPGIAANMFIVQFSTIDVPSPLTLAYTPAGANLTRGAGAVLQPDVEYAVNLVDPFS